MAVPENTTYTFSKSNRLVRYGYIIDFSIATLRLNNRITGYYIRDMYIIDWLNSTLGNKIVFINIIFGLFWGSLRTPKRLFRGAHGSPFEKLWSTLRLLKDKVYKWSGRDKLQLFQISACLPTQHTTFG